MPHRKLHSSFNALLVTPDEKKSEPIERILREYCPQIDILKKACDWISTHKVVKEHLPNLTIIDVNEPELNLLKLLNNLALYNLEVIIITNFKELAFEAFKFRASGFVLKPIEPNDLAAAVRNACQRIRIRYEYESNKKLIDKLGKKLSEADLIGIPTMEGFDFIKVNEIVRCKGLQRCTQIVTISKSTIISSYNLGEFKKLLEPFGFFSPHKSHLINLNYIKKYRKDGSIYMCDNSNIPVSRRRKPDFLSVISRV